jgi:hypothetical protein
MIMGRQILAVIVSLIVAVAIIMISQMLTSLAAQPPSTQTMSDPAALADYMSKLPPIVFAMILIGYAVASFAAGFIVAKMSRQQGASKTLPLIIGVLLTLAFIANVVSLPHPIWFVIVGLLLFIPLALVGHRLAKGPTLRANT